MGFGQPSWVATHLLGDDLATYVRDVRVAVATFGSTTGPFSGIGGAAMSDFTMTYLVVAAPDDYANPLSMYANTDRGSEVTLFFADEQFLGWSTDDWAASLLSLFPRINDQSPLLDTDPGECPIRLPEHITARGTQTADSTREPGT